MNQSLSPRRHANTQIPHYHAYACVTLTNRKRKWELLYHKNGILLWIVTDLWPSFSYGSITMSVCELDTVEESILYIPSYISDYVTKEDKFSAQHIELMLIYFDSKHNLYLNYEYTFMVSYSFSKRKRKTNREFAQLCWHSALSPSSLQRLSAWCSNVFRTLATDPGKLIWHQLRLEEQRARHLNNFRPHRNLENVY